MIIKTGLIVLTLALLPQASAPIPRQGAQNGAAQANKEKQSGASNQVPAGTIPSVNPQSAVATKENNQNKAAEGKQGEMSIRVARLEDGKISVQKDPWDYIYIGAGLVIALTSLILAWTARIQAVSAKASAEAAQKAAVISELAMIASNRAYVHFAGIRCFSHWDNKNSRYFWRIRPSWFNSGNTPTRKLEVRVAYELRDTPLPQDCLFPLPSSEHIPAMIFPKGSIESVTYDIFGHDLESVAKGTKYFYVWGLARYRDVFAGTAEHETRFCCFIDNVMGNPIQAYEAKDNPVEIRFTTYTKHNCADEEC